MKPFTELQILSRLKDLEGWDYEDNAIHTSIEFKDFKDAEATIIGYEEGKGKRKGTLGKFLMQDDDGNKFGCPHGKGY
ncbi:MAG: hypothetical protein DRI70_01130, partial [Bacteroidetes bacterium]